MTVLVGSQIGSTLMGLVPRVRHRAEGRVWRPWELRVHRACKLGGRRVECSCRLLEGDKKGREQAREDVPQAHIAPARDQQGVTGVP